MPYKITELDNGGVVCDYEGVIGLADNIEIYNKIFGRDPSRPKDVSYVIADWSKVAKITHTSDEIRTLAGMTRQRLGRSPETVFAVVVPEDFLFGSARMWQTNVREEKRIKLFQTREEAEAWLKEKLPDKS